MTSLTDRIAAKTDRSGGPEACWPYNGTLVKGRGQISTGGRRTRRRAYVPRLVLADALGRELMPGRFACHHCDNPQCVNPAHLYEGTPQSNVDDMHARGRGKHGPGSKRPDMSVRLIRRIEARDGMRLATLEDWQWFHEEMARVTQQAVDQLIARVERGDGIGVECGWMDTPTVLVEDPELRALIFWDAA